jgi:predicted O-linked N-acetylglucosamine transferase (SPINDLY family)/glycosyltransferase involved in cell wall biosynthesis
MQMIKVLHVIDWLCVGGAARSGMAISKYSSRQGNFQHSIVSLNTPDPYAIALAQKSGMRVQTATDQSTIHHEIEQADIVHVHFWNHPRMYEFLRSDLPAMRLILWFHVAGDFAPQVITKELVDIADFAIPCNPHSAELPVFKNLSGEVRSHKVGMVYDATDFDRVSGVQPKPHNTFNVGYIGHLSFSKMHSNYVPMSAAVEIPNIRFIVCGSGSLDYLKKQTQQLSATDRFDFRGYIEDIKSAIEVFDIYGYPLCEDTYAAAELNLQEVMYAGIPPVVFPYGGVKRLVINNYTGLVVNSELEYKQAIEYLYHHPQERARLGRNARDYAQQIFGAENAAKALNPIYERLMQLPKRKREWGIPAGMSLLEQPILLQDLTGEPKQISGAEKFMEALGDRAPQFAVSFQSQNLEDLLEADRQIAASTPLIYSGEGGIFQYRSFYPNDGYLYFWSGLVLQHLGQYSQAIAHLTQAIELGGQHWRVSWYLAQVAEQSNNISLAKTALQTVLSAAPNFAKAQEMRSRLQSAQSTQLDVSVALNVSQLNSLIEQYQKNSLDHASMTTLRHTRQKLAQQWLALATDQLESQYQSDLGKRHIALWNSGLKNELLTDEEQGFVQRLSAKVAQGFNEPDAIQSLLASTLYLYPHQLSLQYQRAPIPNWFAQSYMQFMFESPRLFKDLGEVDRYADYFCGWIDYLHRNIIGNPDSEVWKYVASVFANSANLTPLYFSDRDLKETQEKRAEILELSLTQKGCQLDYTFPVPSANRTKIRLGILCQNFYPSAETFTVLPVFEQLDRHQFEIYVYALEIGNTTSEQVVRDRAEKFVHLNTSDLNTMAQTMRSDDLDIVLIGSNITARSYPLTLLSIHRLARIQTVSLADPVTTGMRNIDCYIAGNLTVAANAQQSYREKLVTIEGSGLCFRFPPDPTPTLNPTRQSWGATDSTTIYISGANFRKINPEVRHTWAKILAAVPNSILALYPFGPNWGRHPQLEMPFYQQMQATLADYGVAANRLVLIKTLPSTADIYKCLELADIYLDSYPYSGAASALDPLKIGLPMVTMEGTELRHRQSAALLQELQIPDLIARSEPEYIQLAVSLGTNHYLRQQKRTEVQHKMQQTPQFLESRAYSRQIGNLLQNLFQQSHLQRTETAIAPHIDLSQIPDEQLVFTPQILNQIYGCLNLYKIDPSDRTTLIALQKHRRQLTESLLNVTTENLENLYQRDMGKAYQAYLKSGIQKEPLDPNEQSFLQQLTQQGVGLSNPKAINALMGAMLYYAPGTMKVQNYRDRLPQWLIQDYEQVFEQNTTPPTSSQSQVSPTPQILNLPQLSVEFLNRLLGCINLYEIDPSEPSTISELHQLRRQLSEYWLTIPTDQLETVYKTEAGQRYQVLLKSGFQNESCPESDRLFLQEITQMASSPAHPKSLNAMLAAMLYYAPHQLKIQNARTRLPGWLINDYEQVFDLIEPNRV